MNLRSYQLQIRTDVRARRREGHRRILIVAPTGAGKSITLASFVLDFVSRGEPVLWVINRVELIKQTVRVLQALGIDAAPLCATIGGARQAVCQVACIDTMISQTVFPEAALVVADEAHHLYEAALRPYMEASSKRETLILGCTATPARSDGVGLGAVYTALVCGPSIAELVEQGHLVRTVIRTPGKVLQGAVAQRPVDAWTAEGSPGRTLLFAPTKALAAEFAAEFRERGITAEVVDEDVGESDRNAIIARFRSGETAVLANVQVLTEGFDVPDTNCVITTTVGSWSSTVQKTGRGMRPAPGKTRMLWIDLAGASEEHGHPEEPVDFSLEGDGVRKKGDGEPNSPECPVCHCPRSGAPRCEECGKTFAKPLKVTGDPLVIYDKMRREPSQKRAARLAAWVSLGKEKGYRSGWAMQMYKAVYGGWPSSEVMRGAS